MKRKYLHHMTIRRDHRAGADLVAAVAIEHGLKVRRRRRETPDGSKNLFEVDITFPNEHGDDQLIVARRYDFRRAVLRREQEAGSEQKDDG